MPKSKLYEEFVRGSLQKEADERTLNAEKESKERQRNFERELNLGSKRDTDAREKMKQDELKANWEKTEKSSKDIERMTTDLKEKYCKLEEELRRKGNATQEARLKEYEVITAKHTKELDAERLKLEAELEQQGGKLDETQRKIREVRIHELTETHEKMEKLKRQACDREEDRFDKILDEKAKGKEAILEVEKEVSERRNEYVDKRIALQSENHAHELATQAATVETLLIRNSQYDGRVLNDFSGTLERLNVEAEDYFAQCQTHFRDGVVWDKSALSNAERSFRNLSGTCRKISEHLVDMERKLADMPEGEKVKEKVKLIREIKKTLMKAKSCIAVFLGYLSVGNMPRNKEKEDLLQELITDISDKIIDFGGFENHNVRLQNHLKPVILNQENAIQN